jgi:hypothetical protein
MNPGLLFSWLPILGIIIGLLRVRFRRLPWIAAGLVVLAYLLYFAAYGTYAAQCWSCEGGLSETRGDMLLIAGMFFGLMLALTLAGIALGARLTVLLARLFHTVHELRNGGEERPPVT